MFKEAKQCQAFSPSETLFEGQALKEPKSDYTERKKVGKQIFIIPKESVSDLKWLHFLLLFLAAVWRGKYEMRGPFGGGTLRPHLIMQQ